MNSPMLSLLRLHLYKVLVMVVLALLALQYAFSTIFESRRFEPFFTIANHSTGRGGVDVDGSMDRNLKEIPLPLLYKGIHPTLQSSPVNTVEDFQASPALTSQSMTNSSDTSDNSSSNGVKQLNIVETSTESQVLCTNCETKVLNNVSSSSVTTSPPAGMLSCPPVPPNLVGPLEVTKRIPSVKELEKELEKFLGPDFGGLEAGGYGKPHNCKARDRVAVIVPYRDRAEHLRALLLNLHPLLQKQQVEYGIYVIEQAGNGPFNRAMLMNVGFVEASKMHEFDCFIFHDVDLLPEDDRNLYTCPAQPRHMSASIDVFKYKLPYPAIFGGVSAMTAEQFRKVNGFSNMFWGWGGEDDDMANRIKYHHFHISRYPANIARYKMINHKKEKANPKRYDYLYSGQNRFKTDGLSSLRYERKDIELRKFYTWVYVELAAPS